MLNGKKRSEEETVSVAAGRSSRPRRTVPESQLLANREEKDAPDSTPTHIVSQEKWSASLVPFHFFPSACVGSTDNNRINHKKKREKKNKEKDQSLSFSRTHFLLLSGNRGLEHRVQCDTGEACMRSSSSRLRIFWLDRAGRLGIWPEPAACDSRSGENHRANGLVCIRLGLRLPLLTPLPPKPAACCACSAARAFRPWFWPRKKNKETLDVTAFLFRSKSAIQHLMGPLPGSLPVVTSSSPLLERTENS